MKNLLSLFVAALLLAAAAPAAAQSDGPAPDAPPEDDGTPSLAPSLTVGYLNADFNYAGADSTTTPYDFDEALFSLMRGWEHGSLMLSYGSRDAVDPSDPDAGGARPALRTFGAALWAGGNAYLFREFLRLPLSIYVPIRFNAKYRYVSIEAEDPSNAPSNDPSSGDDSAPDLHVVGAGLGAGAGARAKLPVGPSFVRDNLVGQLTYVFSPGLMGNAGQGFDRQTIEQPLQELKLRWATNFNFEVQFNNLLSESVGVTAGYTLRTVSRSSEKPSGAGDVLDAFIDRSDFVEVTDQHVLRVGLTF